MTLYAIFKNGLHKGNERASNGTEAIRKYIISSDLSYFLNDGRFLSQYSFIEAINGVHYNEKTHFNLSNLKNYR